MATIKKGLGKGLNALLGEYTAAPSEGVSEINILDIDVNADQPRKYFSEEKLLELAESIKHHGIVQPIIVRRLAEDRFMVVAGERRYRAARLAGLQTIPCIVRTLSEQQMRELSLIENIQREGLNAIEIAEALNALIEQHDMTHDELSKRMGKSRSAITNALRLLSLPKQIQDDIRAGALTSGQVRPLIGMPEKQAIQLSEIIKQQGLSAREIEQKAAAIKQDTPKAPPKKKPGLTPQLKQFEALIRERIGTKTTIKGTDSKGVITLSYSSRDELEGILQNLDIELL
ncbi:MAG: ParB/RepB/Spo0J family partition protein [Clostridia bacterium]|nr:ParB/RepB/Spo0J family partition protein [Clostridia bacterium]